MPVVSIQQLLLAGTHFGHLTRRWNPKMAKYIFGAKHGIHIIDLKKTQTCIDNACEALQEIVKGGEKVLFVGTKKQAKDIIRSEATRINMPYVCERWLGGMLTNFSTIRKSLKNLQNLERIASDGTYEKISKKERLSFEKDKAKLEKALGGVRDMKKVPGAVFVVDIKKERIAVAEARKLSIPVVAIVDTNTDPDIVDYPIPGNDDAFKSVGLITRALSDAIEEAAAVAAKRRVAEMAEVTGVEEKEQPRAQARRRRPRRRPPRRKPEAAGAGQGRAEPTAEPTEKTTGPAPKSDTGVEKKTSEGSADADKEESARKPSRESSKADAEGPKPAAKESKPEKSEA